MNDLGDLIKLYVNILESIETRENFKNLKYTLKKLNKDFEYNEFFTTYGISDNVRGDIYKISICVVNRLRNLHVLYLSNHNFLRRYNSRLLYLLENLSYYFS